MRITVAATSMALALLLAAPLAHAGVGAGVLCRDKKLRATGKTTLALLKAFGKNLKISNAARLTNDVSKAGSRLTRDFLRAESGGGCETTGDVPMIGAKIDATVADTLDELGPGPCAWSGTCPDFVFITGTGSGACGRINDATDGSGTDLNPFPTATGPTSLDCGTVYCGGGATASPPGRIPDGSTAVFDIVDCSDATAMALAPANSAATGSNRTCTAPGCLFGPPVPLPNEGATGVSSCVTHSVAASPPVSGSLDACSGELSIDVALAVTARVTGDLEPATPGIQPCPTCTNGFCNSGANSGGACTTTTSFLTSHDCLPTQATLVPFGADASPLTTGTEVLSAPGGTFCTAATGQRTAGCFGNGFFGTCSYIEVNGSPGGDFTDLSPHAITLASAYCIPSPGDPLINTVADVPGPGALTLVGTGTLVP